MHIAEAVSRTSNLLSFKFCRSYFDKNVFHRCPLNIIRSLSKKRASHPCILILHEEYEKILWHVSFIASALECFLKLPRKSFVWIEANQMSIKRREKTNKRRSHSVVFYPRFGSCQHKIFLNISHSSSWNMTKAIFFDSYPKAFMAFTIIVDNNSKRNQPFLSFLCFDTTEGITSFYSSLLP